MCGQHPAVKLLASRPLWSVCSLTPSGSANRMCQFCSNYFCVHGVNPCRAVVTAAGSQANVSLETEGPTDHRPSGAPKSHLRGESRGGGLWGAPPVG